MSWKAWVGVALVVGFLGLLGFGLTRDVQKLPSALVGQPVPEFRAATLSGDTVTSAELRGEAVVLNFWASWCVPCRQEHPVLRRAERAWDDDPARVVGVVYQDSRTAARRYMDRLGGSWANLVDPQSRIAIDFGVYGVPETFFLSPDGTVAKKHIGVLTWDLVRSTVDSLLALPAAGADAPTAAGDSAGASASGAAGRSS